MVAAPEPPGQPARSVGWVRGLLSGVLLFMLLAQTGYVLGLVPEFAVPHGYHIARGVLAAVGTVVTAGLAILVGFETLFANRRRDLRPFGFARPTRLVSSLAIAFAVALPAYVVALAITAALQLPGTTNPTIPHHAAGELIYYSCLAVLVAPWVEEIAVRGMIFSTLDRRFGFWPAGITSALLWAGGHFTPAVLLIFTVSGTALAFIRKRTGSLLPGIALHGTQNTIASIVALGAGWLAAPFVAALAGTIVVTWRWAPRPANAG